MILKCKRCDNEWNYKGENPYYATCSRCLNKVKIVKNDLMESGEE